MPTQELLQPVTGKTILDDCVLTIHGPLPFTPVVRMYTITDSDPTQLRGFHAHKKTNQVIFCPIGSFRLVVDNGQIRDETIVKNPKGFMLPPMLWHEMHDITPNAVIIVLASLLYDEQDYIRDYATFLKALT